MLDGSRVTMPRLADWSRGSTEGETALPGPVELDCALAALDRPNAATVTKADKFAARMDLKRVDCMRGSVR